MARQPPLDDPKLYASQTRVMLQGLFPRISVAAIDGVISSSPAFGLERGNAFTDAFATLTNMEERRRAGIDGNGAGLFDAVPAHIKVFIKSNRKLKRFRPTHPQLIDEIDSIPEINTKGQAKSEVVDLTSDDLDDEENGEGEVKVGTADAPDQAPEIECLCCYGDYPLVELRECVPGSGHFVCKQCISSFVSGKYSRGHFVVWFFPLQLTSVSSSLVYV